MGRQPAGGALDDDPGGEDPSATRLHLLGAVARLERSPARERQREDTALAEARGVHHALAATGAHAPAGSAPGRSVTSAEAARPLDRCIDTPQHRRVSNRSVPVEERRACCPPLVRSAMSADRAADLAAMFKALGDPVRLRLVSMVASHAGGEACVCDLTPAFDLSQPTISHHLRVLREAGLLERERRGTWVFYSAVPAALAQLAAVLGPADPSVPTASPSQVPA